MSSEHIYFDAERAYSDYRDYMIGVLDTLCVQLLQFYSANTRGVKPKLKEFNIADIDSFWQKTLDTRDEVISAYVGNVSWGAYLSNYGTGSKLDRNNPNLDEYMSDDRYGFNQERANEGFAVLGREEGEYNAPDYKKGTGFVEKYSSGKFAGINLEKLPNKKFGGKPYFTPVEATHWFENSNMSFENIFWDTVWNVHNKFDWGRYIKTKGG